MDKVEVGYVPSAYFHGCAYWQILAKVLLLIIEYLKGEHCFHVQFLPFYLLETVIQHADSVHKTTLISPEVMVN